MPTLFANCPGRVVQVRQPTSYCDIRMIAINNQSLTDLSYERSAVILTRITVSHQVNAQFLHTVGNRVYIYSFGDRIGQITFQDRAVLQTTDVGCFANLTVMSRFYIRAFAEDRLNAR